MLARVVDSLAELIGVTLAAAGNKPPRLKPVRRPVTALDQVRQEHRHGKHRRMVDLVREAEARYLQQHPKGE